MIFSSFPNWFSYNGISHKFSSEKDQIFSVHWIGCINDHPLMVSWGTSIGMYSCAGSFSDSKHSVQHLFFSESEMHHKVLFFSNCSTHNSMFVVCALQACAHYSFGELCLYSAMSYFDRFLSVYELPLCSLERVKSCWFILLNDILFYRVWMLIFFRFLPTFSWPE